MPLFEPVFARIQSSSEAIRFSVAQIISRLPRSFVIGPADQTPGMSAFLIENGAIDHTYSTCGRRGMPPGACIRGWIVLLKGVETVRSGAGATSTTLAEATSAQRTVLRYS